MKNELLIWATLAWIMIGFAFYACGPGEPESVKIGINAPITGDIPKVGEGTQYAAEMWLEDINAAGGIQVGDQKYPVELVIRDNRSRSDLAVEVNIKLITEDEVLAIVGPQASKQAIPAADKANELETPMISPWSTNPHTTRDRPYIFRGAFLDSFQASVIARVVKEEYGFTKAAVLYDMDSSYPKGLAELFRKAWLDLSGLGSVVAFETFNTNDTDFGSQLTKINHSGAEFIFTPQYYYEVAAIVRQAHQMGWDKPIVGSDSWGSADLLTNCHEDCHGLIFSTHYAAAVAKGATKEFIDRYRQKYGYVPDDVAALTWDCLRIIQKAIQETGVLTGDISENRKAVRDALANIKDFNGITGKMTFSKEGDPLKCVTIVQISNAGKFAFYKLICP